MSGSSIISVKTHGCRYNFRPRELVIATVIGVASSLFIFSGGLPQVGTVSTAATAEKISLLAGIIDIIPKDLVTPVVERNLLQVIFVAVIFGLCINKLGDRVKPLHDFVKAANTFCLTIITAIAAFVPLVTFFAMATMVINLGTDSIILLGKLFTLYLSGLFIMVVIYFFILVTFGKISPIPM